MNTVGHLPLTISQGTTQKNRVPVSPGFCCAFALPVSTGLLIGPTSLQHYQEVWDGRQSLHGQRNRQILKARPPANLENRAREPAGY